MFVHKVVTIHSGLVLWIQIRIRIRSDPKLLAGSGKIIPDPDSSVSETNLE
jgi:hypothetical protein